MGGVQVVCPSSAVEPLKPFLRISKPSKEVMEAVSKIDIEPCPPYSRGLAKIEVSDMNSLMRDFKREPESLSHADVLWLCLKILLNSDKVKGWNGFMEEITSHLEYDVSSIIYLPFINKASGHYDTIYTDVRYDIQETEKIGQHTTVVTFDQPLYVKARDLVAQHAELGNVVVRLGGFHTLLSYLMCIGHIMAGTGLQEVLSLIYAPNSMQVILHGHAYSRAIRAHFLVHFALMRILLRAVELNVDQLSELQNFAENFPTLQEICESPILQSLKEKIQNILISASEGSKTAKLWVEYIAMINLLKNFLRAERSGNWELHLECVRNMLPYFQCTGHHLYAKCAHLYLQDMLQLKDDARSMISKNFYD